MTPRWQVEIVHPVTGKPKAWDTYADRERAESVAATLRQHKLFAQVRRVDMFHVEQPEAPEHGNDRRKFLVWAVLAGFAEPARLTERVTAEVAPELNRLPFCTVSG